MVAMRTYGLRIKYCFYLVVIVLLLSLYFFTIDFGHVFDEVEVIYRSVNITEMANLPVFSQRWQSVGKNTDVYLYSAYAVQERKIVQVIVIAKEGTPERGYRCVFQNESYNIEWVVPGRLELFPEHHGHQYRAGFIRCPITNDLGASRVQIELKGISQPVRILYPRVRAYTFTVCVPSLFGPYTDVKSIVEMIEADLMFGADKFIFYNYSVSPDVDRLLKYYIQKEIIEVNQWNIPVSNVHYYGQLALLQDCILANRIRTKFLVLKDIDELIVPRKEINWNQMMKNLHKDSSRFGSYLFRNAFFGTNDFEGSDVGQMKLIVSDHVREDKIFNARDRSKVIVLPERVRVAGIHFVWAMERGFSETTVDTAIGLLHHYRKGNSFLTIVIDTRMRTYVVALIAKVNHTLQDFKKIAWTNER